MRPAGIMAVITFTALSSACADEARQLAWTGPGSGPCLFGGVTERADEHCAQINFGIEGVLAVINDRALARSGRGGVSHVTALRRELAHRADLRAEPLYSCAAAFGESGECHVSLLVRTHDGRRFVLDDGAVVGDTVGAGGVASFAAFEEAVEGVMWVGRAPTSEEIAAKRRSAR